MSTTVVVIIASFIFAFYLWAADIVILKVYEGIFRVLS
jgi:preprotein translocase subunit SecE